MSGPASLRSGVSDPSAASREAPPWIRDVIPAGSESWSALSIRNRDEAGWELEARFWRAAVHPGIVVVPPQEPSEVIVRWVGEGASPGVNASVMRRSERLLTEALAEWRGAPDSARAKAEAFVAERLSALPPNPRKGGDAYYMGLRELYAEVRERGYSEPLNLLCKVAGIPKSTLTTRLRVADEIARGER